MDVVCTGYSLWEIVFAFMFSFYRYRQKDSPIVGRVFHCPHGQLSSPTNLSQLRRILANIFHYPFIRLAPHTFDPLGNASSPQGNEFLLNLCTTQTSS